MKHLNDVATLIKTLQQSTTFHALVIQSPPGWAKSSTIERVLEELELNFISLGCYATPLSLFNALAKAPASLFVLDDSAGLYGDVIAMSILKAATWSSAGNGGVRQVSWLSTSEKVLTPTFIFSGKLILLTNTLPKGKETEAFLSRTLHLAMNLSPQEISEMLFEAAQSKTFYEDTELAMKVANHLVHALARRDFTKINLRTLKMGYELAIANPQGWVQLLEKMLPEISVEELVEELSARDINVEEQIREFTQRSGLTRRSFFNYRKRLGITQRVPSQFASLETRFD